MKTAKAKCENVRNNSGYKKGRKTNTFYYKAGDEEENVQRYDLQLLYPDKSGGAVNKDKAVKGMKEFAQCAIEIAVEKKLSRSTALLMMRREMDLGVIHFDEGTAEEIVLFASQLALKAGLEPYPI